MVRRGSRKLSMLGLRGLSLGVVVFASNLAWAERLPLKSFTTGEGLLHNGINRIVRDSRGFLWFCTEEGLSRFDGYTFTNYGVEQGLPHRNVTDFLETRSGECWVATSGGLVCFNPRGTPLGRVVYANDAVTPPPMFTVSVPTDEDPKARAATVLLESHDGAIWCGTMKRLYYLERRGGRFELLPADIKSVGGSSSQISPTDLLEDRNHCLWIGSFEGLFQRSPDGTMKQYTKRDGLPDINIHDLLEDHEGRLWVGTRLGGFFRLEVSAGQAPRVAEVFSRKNGLPTDWIFQLYETADGRFWVATNKGLIQFFPGAGEGHARRFNTYTRRNGLSFQEVTALAEDSGGNLWLGTNTAGAMKLARNGLVTYGEQDGIISVHAIFEDPAGGICFRGVVLGDQRPRAFDGAKLDLLRGGADTFFPRFGRFDGQRLEWFKPAISFDFGFLPDQAAVQTREGEWWVGSGAGLYRFPPSDSFASIKIAIPVALYTTRQGLPTQQVGRIFADSTGNIWVSGFGLACWNRATQALRNLGDAPGLPSPAGNYAGSFGEDRAGNIWIAFNTGVARYRDGRFTFFSVSDGLPMGPIREIHSDRVGRLWLTSSRGGLIRLDDPAAERPAFSSFTTAQGLSSNSIGAITEDLYGRIYVGTARGIDQLDPETGRIKHYTTDDGLAPGNIVAAFRDRTGALWFGTHRGLSRFIPAPENSAPPPPILITGVRVSGDRQLVSALGETEIVLPDLAPHRNQLQFDFVALGFAPGEELSYQYQLDGAGEGWSPLTEQRSVTFANLSPGRYRVLVRAVNADAVMSDPPASLSFTILPPIWQRWWFITAAAAILGFVAYALYRYRLTRLLEVERVRTRIASDLHDDVGANLTRIAILSEVAQSRLTGIRDQRSGVGEDRTELNAEASGIENPLSSIAQISRESVASMGDIVWAINPKRDHLTDLIQRMRRLASEVLACRKIEYEFKAPDPDTDLRLGADVRRDVLLIFKEALNNVVRHSDCSTVRIELWREHSWLNLRIVDDGCGFHPEHPSEGNGLTSMKQRARGLDGELKVTSVEAKGTEVTLRVPHRPR